MTKMIGAPRLQIWEPRAEMEEHHFARLVFRVTGRGGFCQGVVGCGDQVTAPSESATISNGIVTGRRTS